MGLGSFQQESLWQFLSEGLQQLEGCAVSFMMATHLTMSTVQATNAELPPALGTDAGTLQGLAINALSNAQWWCIVHKVGGSVYSSGSSTTGAKQPNNSTPAGADHIKRLLSMVFAHQR
jgi:hypothetical protein